MKTLHPETEVINSRMDGDTCVYTVMRDGAAHEVRVPLSAFKNVVKGPLGKPQRRAILAKALREG